MTSIQGPRFESVRTDAGYHGRFRAANGEPVWTTETYVDEREVMHAVNLLNATALVAAAVGNQPVEVARVDERSGTD